MKYAVVWSRRASSALAEIWLQWPGEHDDIRAAANSIDRLLSANPVEQGESRDNGRRVLFVPPLIVTYRVDGNAPVVHVLGIRGMRRRGDR